MKYILIFMWTSIVFVPIFILAFLACIWYFNTKVIKDMWSEYRMQYARMMWKAFRINKY